MSDMIKAMELPEEFITGTAGASASRLVEPMVEKRTLEGIDEVQYLYVAPWTSIKMHGHDDQWEVWERISHKQAYVCLKGEEHELVNNCGSMMVLRATKGHTDYSYDDIAELFWRWGFSVYHGSLVVNED